jgi:hypothetical protein
MAAMMPSANVTTIPVSLLQCVQECEFLVQRQDARAVSPEATVTVDIYGAQSLTS